MSLQVRLKCGHPDMSILHGDSWQPMVRNCHQQVRLAWKLQQSWELDLWMTANVMSMSNMQGLSSSLPSTPGCVS